MRLLLDAMCGGVRVHCRMCGHDTAYTLDRDLEADDAIVAAADAEDRTVVTRDRSLARSAAASVLVEATDVDGQLRALADAGVDLALDETPTYCGRCNGPLTDVAADADVPEYAPDPAETDIWRCADCDQHFWKGSHWESVAATIDAL